MKANPLKRTNFRLHETIRNLVIAILILLSYSAKSQSLNIFNVDVSAFPTVKAKLYAFDSSGTQITNLSQSDFELKENGRNKTITYLSCPKPKPPQALSCVLVMDVSGSMIGNNLYLAKEAAKAWIEALPTDNSECAVSSFDEANYLNQDFTTDKDKMLAAINNLKAMGGTDYDASMLNPLAGGLLVTKYGRYKRVIVFLSDGQPNKEPQISKIIQEANAQNVTVYSVTLGMPCPNSMRQVSEQTGGQWFENVTTVENARHVYQQILQTAQGSDPCEIQWLSGISCVSGYTFVELTLLTNGTKAETYYQKPNTTVAKLEFNPQSLVFGEPQIGLKNEQKVTVTAKNADFTITDITSSNAAFTLSPNPPIVINSGKSVEFTVGYNPADSGYNYCKFEIETNVCPAKYHARGGWKGWKPTIRTLKLIHPNGGEVFVVGSDTVITWEGVSPDEPVKLEYSIDNGANWNLIADSVKNLSYLWRVPKTPSNQCIARVTSSAEKIYNSKNDMVLITADTFRMGNTGAYAGDNDEKPQHYVTISRDFLMSEYEITQGQYEEVMGTNPSYFKGDNLPVENVSWYDAVEFCNKLSEIKGLEKCYSGTGTNIVCDWDANGYRLPTEAEWEYACKARRSTDFYNGSLTNSDCTPLDDYLDKIGWYCGNSGNMTHEVGQKEPNEFGLYDMSGNVWEWCWDWYGTYSPSAVIDPKGAKESSYKVRRGGGWYGFATYCRSAFRYPYTPTESSNDLGFRVVISQ